MVSVEPQPINRNKMNQRSLSKNHLIELPWMSLTSTPWLAKRSSNLSATTRESGAAAEAMALSEVMR